MRRRTLVVWGLVGSACAGSPGAESDSSSMATCGVEVPWAPHGAAWQGNALTLLGHSGDVAQLDVSDPFAPRLLGGVPLGAGTPGPIASDGSLVLAAMGEQGVHVLMFSEAGPVLVGRLEGLHARAVAMRPSRGYVATGTEIVVLDLTDPAAPRVVGRAPAAGDQLLIAGAKLHVVGLTPSGAIEVQIFDVGTDAPRPLGRVPFAVEHRPSASRAVAIAPDGSQLVIDTQNSLAIFDLPGGDFHSSGLTRRGEVVSLAVGDGVLFAAERRTGPFDVLHAIALGPRRLDRQLALEPIPGIAHRVVASGRTAIVVHGDETGRRDALLVTTVDRMKTLMLLPSEVEPNDGGASANFVPSAGDGLGASLSAGEVDTFWTTAGQRRCDFGSGELGLGYGDELQPAQPRCTEERVTVAIDVRNAAPVAIEQLADDCVTPIALDRWEPEPGLQRFVASIAGPIVFRLRSADGGEIPWYSLRVGRLP